MKTHYDLIGVKPAADSDEVKRSFRREIARYHPDKVQHLGAEFQEIAAARAAALTEAYRVLMDTQLRQRYDAGLEQAPPVVQEAERPASNAPVPSPYPPAPPIWGPADRATSNQAVSAGEFVRRAISSRLRDVVSSAGGTLVNVPAFDWVFYIKGRRTLFRKPEPTVRVAVRIVSRVDAAAVSEAWGAAVRLVAPDETMCLMLVGSGIAPARELSVAVSDLRQKTRRVSPIVVPVDVRDWSALFPPETPAVLRLLLDRLRQGD